MVVKNKIMKELRSDSMQLGDRILWLMNNEKDLSDKDRELLTKTNKYMSEVHSNLMRLEFIF
jgi:hypothetical protein